MGMNSAEMLLVLAGVAYLIGSIPFGLFVGLAKGIDVRKAGSGNIGATNVGRLLGKKFFWIVFFLDLLKGLLPTLAAGAVTRFNMDDRTEMLLWLLVAFAAIFGHMFSIFLKFKGGRGVATSAGAMLGIWPYFTIPAVAGLIIFAVVKKVSGYVSLGSIIAAIGFAVSYVAAGLILHWPILTAQLPLLIAAILLAASILLRHRANIVRLLAGTEHKPTSDQPPRV